MSSSTHFERPASEHVGSAASKCSRQLTEQEFGIKSSTTSTTRMTRKVHQTLPLMVEGAWSGEVAIFESKPVVSDATCERQHNKSIRLNTAIFKNLESHGLDICLWYPIITEIRAASADFYTIKKYENMLGVGRMTIRNSAPPALRERGHGGCLGKTTISVSRDAAAAADPHHAVQ
ncbi:hypothetical protein KI688_006985 [Linnemannia hyalina]|uniref:Uncharacterized protein n=1 Tax=Linnemannia hyalina TaxID=64524 RepID=A0A9P7XJR3_9FUNG|nr:hypothetical protein KI688_006985 [Linnemannia hyalina]